MKIVCPSCDANYEVPELVVTSRRKMRCARCGKDWVPGDAALTPAEDLGVPGVGVPEGGVPEGGVPEGGVPEGGMTEGALPAAGMPGRGEALAPAAPDVAIAAPKHEADLTGFENAFDDADDMFAQAGEAAAAAPGARTAPPPEIPLPGGGDVTPRLAGDAAPRSVALRPATPVAVMTTPSGRPVFAPVAAPEPAAVPFMAWGASIAALVAVLALALIFRGPVMKAWPPSARLYAMLGLGER